MRMTVARFELGSTAEVRDKRHALTTHRYHLYQLVGECGVESDCVPIGIDNQAAKELIEDPLSASRTKHIDIVHHHVRERVAMGWMEFEKIGTLECLIYTLNSSNLLQSLWVICESCCCRNPRCQEFSPWQWLVLQVTIHKDVILGLLFPLRSPWNFIFILSLILFTLQFIWQLWCFCAICCSVRKSAQPQWVVLLPDRLLSYI